jgi:TP901 family phage tail tape measure protein
MTIRTVGVRYDLIGRDSASRAFNSAGNSASRLERGFGKLGKAAKGLSLALGVGIAAGLAEGTKKAVEFQAEMLRIQTQAGGTAKDVKILSAQVLELGKTAEQGPQELSEALYHLKAVGMDNVQAMKALKTSSDLAAVGGSDLEATTNALAGAWRTGIRGATNMNEAAQTLNATIGAGNISMEDMVAALGTGILPTAKTFGLTLSQVGAALALFTDEGVDSASAATRLRMSISLLGAPSRAAEKQLDRIHLSGQKLGDAMRGPEGLIGAMKLLKAHLDASGLSATQSAALLSHAFGGGKSSSAILSMINNLDVLEQKQEQVNSSMGKYGPAVAEQRKSAAAQIKIIKSNLEVFAIQAGDLLLPPLTKFVTYMTTTALPAVHHFGHELATRLVPVDAIKAQFGRLTGAVGDFFAGFKPASTKAKLKVPTPQIAGPTIPSLLRKPYTFKVPSPTLKGSKSQIPDLIAKPKAQASQAKQFGQQLRALISGGIGDAIKSAPDDVDWGKLGRQIGSGLGKAIGWLGQHMADLTKKVIKALSKIDFFEVGKSFGKMAVPLSLGILRTLFDPLFSASFWRKHWLDTIIAVVSVIPVGRVGGALGKVLEKVPVLKMFAPFLKRIGGLGRLVEKALGKGFKVLGRAGRVFLRGFVEGFEKVFPAASRTVRGKLDDLVAKVFGYWARAGAAGLRIVKGLRDGIVGGIRWVGDAAGQLAGRVVKAFGGAGSWLVSKGGALVRGLLAGIAAGAKGIGKWLGTHLVQPVVTWVKSLFGIHSPSTVFAGIGRDLVAGLLAGITTAALGIGKWVRAHVVAPVLGVFSGARGWLVSHGKGIVSGLATGMTAAAKNLRGWTVSHLVNPIKNAFSGAGDWLYQHGVDLMSGLLRGIKRGFQSVSGYLGSTVKGALKGVGGALGHIPGFASGGLAPVGTMAWVGERGPELMRVTTAGARIYSTGRSMAMVDGMALPPSRPFPVPAARHGATPPAPQPAPPTAVNVYFNDRRLMDLIDVEVEGGVTVAKKYTDTEVGRSAHRATVGRR